MQLIAFSPHCCPQFRIPSVTTDATPYSVAKWGGEKFCRTNATESFQIIAIRIGWCQPGDNMPATLSATGTPTVGLGEPCGESSTVDGYDSELEIEQWFRLMWLSNRDLLHLMDRCVQAPWPEASPLLLLTVPALSKFPACSHLVHCTSAMLLQGAAPFMVVNGMSKNTGMRWDITNDIGYSPNDNVTEHLEV